MRLEKGYRAFGRELTPDYNPVEAGLLFACKLQDRHPVPRPGGGRAGEEPTGRAASWSPSSLESPDADAVGRRAGAARRPSPPGRSSRRRGARPSAPASGSPISGTRTATGSTGTGSSRAPTRSTSTAPANRPRSRSGRSSTRTARRSRCEQVESCAEVAPAPRRHDSINEVADGVTGGSSTAELNWWRSPRSPRGSPERSPRSPGWSAAHCLPGAGRHHRLVTPLVPHLLVMRGGLAPSLSGRRGRR